MNSNCYDIVVSGAGMVGAAAALVLSQNGFRVALVESSRADDRTERKRAEYDLRVSAISPSSRAILERCGIWSQLDPTRICYYEKMSVWHQPGSAIVELDAVDLARDNLGAIVENRLLQQSLVEACGQQTEIDRLMPERIEALLRNDSDGVEICLASGQCIRAALLIVADGRQSTTRDLAGIQIQAGSYHQTAIVANVDTEYAHAQTARQRFLKTGPLAFLPLANGQSSIVWSCDDDVVAEFINLDDAAFCQRLGQAFEFKLGRVTQCSARASFALGWHNCEQWLKNRVLVIGDAAHSVHPLAGQGVNLGFSDVDLLGKLLANPQRLMGQSLRRFERQRKSETWFAGIGINALKRIYAIDQPQFARLRDLGVHCINETTWLRRAIMQKAVQNLN